MRKKALVNYANLIRPATKTGTKQKKKNPSVKSKRRWRICKRGALEREKIRRNKNKNKKIFFTQLRLHVIQFEKKREINTFT